MILNDFEKRWLDVTYTSGVPTVKRVDNIHPLDFFVGFDSYGRYIFLLISSVNLKMRIDSQSIHLDVRDRRDGFYSICFTLINNDQQSVFFRLCFDLFDYCKNAINELIGISMLHQRFIVWQRLFQKGDNILLSTNIIKGLIGELLFMRDYCFDMYGIEKTISAWIGAEKAHKDFVFSDTWYEVKALNTSNTTVNISSLEQLDSQQTGYLMLMFLNKTSFEDINRISLCILVNEIRDLIKNKYESLNIFERGLIDIGYLDKPEYDKMNYCLCKVEKYKVDKCFPKIIRKMLNSGIANAEYKLDIAYILNWKVKV